MKQESMPFDEFLNIFFTEENLTKQFGSPIKNKKSKKSYIELKPMSFTEFLTLKVGDKVHIKWAKDDEPHTTTRCDAVYELISIEESGTRILENRSEWIDIWEIEPDIPHSHDDNVIEMTRGYAYAFYPEGNSNDI